MTAHTATRTPHPVRFPGLARQVTYSCNACPFTITDTGDEAKLQWLRHELRADLGVEVEA